MLVLSPADVEAALDPDALVDAVAAAMADLSAGAVSMPPRTGVQIRGHGALYSMLAHLPSRQTLTSKLVSFYPRNVERPSHQAVIVCFDPDTGTPIAIMDGTTITEKRTAACAALSVRLLARAGATSVAIVGTGVQARAHIDLVRSVVPDATFTIAGRDAAAARAVAADTGVTAAPTVEAAVRDADVVCATTSTDRPVVAREWLRPGVHVTSVGFNFDGTGELDVETYRDALVAVESRDTVLAPSPAGSIEIRAAVEAGALEPGDIVEIGELVAGTVAGRTGDEQITVYKSVGVAVQDAAAAALVLERAAAQGLGTDVPL